MGFVESSLGSGEQVLLKAKVHWVIYLIPAAVVVAGAIIGGGGFVLSALGVVLLAVKFAQAMTTELAVTDRKVLAKFGVIRRSTIEQQLSRVDSIQVSQGILGRVVNAGSVKVNGSGISATPIPGIANPLAFRRAVSEAMERINSGQSNSTA